MKQDVLRSAVPPLSLALLMWGLAAAFYLFGFFQRVTPAALAQELAQELAPTATALGWLSATYFYCYAVMQLPAGLLADRFGPRRLFIAATAAAVAGTLLFAWAETFAAAAVGRGIIGAAAAVGWIGMLKLAAHWFSPQKFASISGLSLTVGTIGAVLAGFPLRLLSDEYGWRNVVAGSAGFAALVLLGMLFILRDDPAERGYRSWAPAPQTDDALAKISVWDSLRTLPKKDLALLCLGQTAVTGSVVMMAGLWGVPFLTTLFDVSSRTAVGLTSLIPIGFAAGSLVFGPWSDRTGRRKKPLLVGTLGVFAGFILLASGISLSSLWATAALLSMIGISSGSMVVAFAYGKDLVGGRRTATITALVNLSVTLGSLGLQPLFGVILDWQWDGLVVEGVRRYDATAFQWGFAATALWLGLTAIAQWKTRDAVSPAKTLGLASPGG
ncbi:MAG: MFS transporter [Betaproteobacteria bacterium]|nr:MFS transporter [Betaproteobacteria bacterium]